MPAQPQPVAIDYRGGMQGRPVALDQALAHPAGRIGSRTYCAPGGVPAARGASARLGGLANTGAEWRAKRPSRTPSCDQGDGRSRAGERKLGPPPPPGANEALPECVDVENARAAAW